MGSVEPEVALVEHSAHQGIRFLNGPEKGLQVPSKPAGNVAIPMLRALQYIVILILAAVNFRRNIIESEAALVATCQIDVG